VTFEPGPSKPSEMPMAARVVTPGLFLRLASQLVSTIAGADTGLIGAAAVIAPFSQRELGAQFGADVAPAAGSIGSIDDASEGQTVAEIAGALGYVGDQATVERRDLPYPDQLEPNDELNQPIEPDQTAPGGHDGGPDAD
jgi:hypothetical protein